MSILQIEFRMDNASFDENPKAEAVRVIRELADRLENSESEIGDIGMKIRDVNGNTIGEMYA